MTDADSLALKYGRAMSFELTQRLKIVGEVSHRGESGRARENCVKDWLRTLLPPGLGLDTGIVIDANGQNSWQIDVIVYRPEYHQVFEIAGVKHFPVESVVAAFEVKARLESGPQVRAALENVTSVKKLDRTGRGSNYILPSRTLATEMQDDFRTQVFTGVIVEKSMAAQSVCENFVDFIRPLPRRHWPNIYTAINDFALRYRAENSITADPTQADGIAFSDSSGEHYHPPLVDLGIEIANTVRVSALVDFNPSNYFQHSHSNVLLDLDDHDFPGRRTYDQRLEREE